MKLTQHTDYAMRVLMYLGVRDGELATITGIAEAYGISRNHVMKVVHELAQVGYVETVRGRGGGLRLRCEPETVNIGAVVRHMENHLELVECLGASNHCRLTPVCVLQGAVSEALDAFLAVLDRYTLADLIAPRSALVRQLGIVQAL